MPTKTSTCEVFPLYYDLQAKNLFGTTRNVRFTIGLALNYREEVLCLEKTSKLDVVNDENA